MSTTFRQRSAKSGCRTRRRSPTPSSLPWSNLSWRELVRSWQLTWFFSTTSWQSNKQPARHGQIFSSRAVISYWFLVKKFALFVYFNFSWQQSFSRSAGSTSALGSSSLAPLRRGRHDAIGKLYFGGKMICCNLFLTNKELMYKKTIRQKDI